MTDETATFSVEVVGFSPTVPQDQLVSQISEAFGIGSEDAERLIAEAPVRVKKGVDGEAARMLASQLLALGADVRITNDATGEERDYQAKRDEADAPAQKSISVIPPPMASAADKAAPDPAFVRAQAGSAMMDALKAARARADAAKERGEDIGQLKARPGAPVLPLSKLDGDREGPPKSVPPPGQNEDCKRCQTRVKAGEICPSCGWSNSLKRRLNPRTGKPVPFGSKQPALPILFLILGIGAAAAGYLQVSILAAASGLAAGMALALLAIALSSGFKQDKFVVPSKTFTDEEKKQVSSRRLRSIVGAVVFAAIAGAVWIPAATASSELRMVSFGLSWSGTLSGVAETSGDQGELSTSAGSLTVRKTTATVADANPYHYGFILVVTVDSKSKDIGDSELFAEVVPLAMTWAVPGAELNEGGSAKLDDSDDGAQGSFGGGTIDGTEAEGQYAAYRFGGGFVFIAYFAAKPLDEAAKTKGAAFLGSLQVAR